MKEEISILKKNPDLARAILQALRDQHRELEEKCPRCGTKLWSCPEADTDKYCPDCGLMFDYD